MPTPNCSGCEADVLHTGGVTEDSLYRALTDQTRIGARPFLESPDGWELGFEAFHRRCDGLAAALYDRGARRGDRLVVQIPKSVDAFALYLAALRLGAVYVPLNPAYTLAEVSHIVHDAAPALYVGDVPVDAPSVALAELAEAAATLGDAPEDHSAAGDTTATMLYTSGTTGRPKGAPASSHGLLTNARDLMQRWRITNEDVLVHVLPIFHVHGLFVALHTALLSRCRVVFHDRFDPVRAVSSLRSSTVFMGVPTMYTRMLALDALDSVSTARMRLFTSGSAPLPASIHDAFRHRTGHRIVERYGLTETGILTSNRIGAEVPGSVGVPLEHVELRLGISDLPGVGEVEVRGPGVIPGYWRSPEADAETFSADGWFRTGDMGSLDADGALRLLGRRTDVVISGGLNVYPAEVEAAILEKGIEEVAVIGLPHPDLGEAVAAVVVGGGSRHAVAEDLTTLASFKHPLAWIEIEELPRNAMGKVEKEVLRRRFGSHFT